jgi:hypothetical protein
VRPFWDWLQYQGESGRVKLPKEIMDEVRAGREDDLLVNWIKEPAVESALLLQETFDVALLRHIINAGYAPDLTDIEVDGLGKDPFLIAYAHANPAERCVVTVEVKRNAIRQNRRIPNVCEDLGVQWCGPFDLNRRLGFKTDWRSA